MTKEERGRSAIDQLAEYRSRLASEVEAVASLVIRAEQSTEVGEVVTGIIAHQASFVSRMAECVHLWDRDIGQLVVRSVLEAHINLAWILENPEDRAMKFVQYGAGQRKLEFEHLKDALSGDDDAKDYIKDLEDAINAERHLWITDVNLGSWSGEDLRSMAESVGLRDAYRLVYQPMSGAVHGMWHHLTRSVLSECQNELHIPHKRAIVPEYRQEVGLFWHAVGQVDECLRRVRAHYGLSDEPDSAATYIFGEMEKLSGTGVAASDETGTVGGED